MANIRPLESKPSSEQVSTAKEQLQKCLQTLQVTQNDNEKLACLMLFTHIMKNNASLSVEPSEIFEAIGAQFIVRLLNNKTVPEGCPTFMYKGLALNILASFTEHELIFQPLITSNLRVIADILVSHQNSPETSEIYEDSLKIFLIFSRTQKGCEHLIETNCIPVILQCLLHNPEIDSLFEILKGLLVHVPHKIWANNAAELDNYLKILAQTFAESQELNKFTVCGKIVYILQSLCQSLSQESHKRPVIGKEGWADNLRKGVRDILQSRCKISFKYKALQLGSCMVELFGIEWTLETTDKVLDLSNTKFWYILLSIVKTELKMILESDNSDEIQEKSSALISCYKILEKSIEFLISDQHGGLSLNDELILQVHSMLVASFDCIIEFLLQVGTTMDNTNESDCCYRRPIVVATVRVLCAWLSEETNSLSDKVSKVLPILLDWAKKSFEEGKISEATDNNKQQDEIISYLLPPFCHLSADESFCVILIQNKIHITLASYFDQLWQRQQTTVNNNPSLVTLCNIFLNLCVLHVDLIKSEPIFHNILDTIMLSLPTIAKQSNLVVLAAHFTLLGLMLFRYRYPTNCATLTTAQESFLESAINFLKHAQISLSVTHKQPNEIHTAFQQEWDEISELWFLSLQNIIACAKTIKPAQNVLELSGWINETKNWLDESNMEDGVKNLGDLESNSVSIADID